jgi:phytoene synthase
MADAAEMLPFQTLVAASASKARARVERIFMLDNACAQIARAAREPIMAQIRLAWWRDGLLADRLTAQHDAPDMVALRAINGFERARPGLVAMVDGWEELILGGEGGTHDMLMVYAGGRGAGLFAALAPECGAESAAAGRVWALWDLAGHLSDATLAEESVNLAKEMAQAVTAARLPRMLKMMVGPAIADVSRGRGAPPLLTPGLYARMMRIQLFGR